MIKNKLQIIMAIVWICVISIFMAIAVYALTTTKELKFFAGIKYNPTIIVDVYINDNLVFSSRAPGEVNQDYIDNIVNDTINFNSNIIAGETYNIRIVNCDTQKDIIYTINNNGELSGVIEKNNGTNSNEATETITITETGLGQTLFSIKLEILYDLKYLFSNDSTGIDFGKVGKIETNSISGTTFYVSNVDGLLNLSALVGQVNTTTTKYGSDYGYDNSAGPAVTFSGATIQMLNDIDCENGDNKDNFEKTFIPIGYYNFGDINNSFQGTFDGNNKSINGLYVNATEEIRLSGLFGYALNAEIKNLKMKNCKIIADMGGGSIVAYAPGSMNINNCSSENTYISGTSSGSIVGGIAGNFGDGTITNCYNTGSVDGVDMTGGVVGGVYNGTITNCYNAGTVSGGNAGGIVGDVYAEVTITDCYNAGTVSGGDAGGIMGYGRGTITNCYNKGSIGGDYVGGIVGGVIGELTITNCYNTASITSSGYSIGGIVGENFESGEVLTILNCFNTGNIISNGENVGGIGGWLGRGVTTITNCYNTASVSGSNNVGGIVGRFYGGTSLVTNCYNTGSVSGSSNIGGIAGYASETITNCYNTGSVSGSSNYVGGIVGDVPGEATITNCYNTGSVSGSYVGGIVGVLRSTYSITNCYYLKTESVNANIHATANVILDESSYYGTFSSASDSDNVIQTSSANLAYNGNILTVLNAYINDNPIYTDEISGVEIALVYWEIRPGENGGYPLFVESNL